MREVEADRGAAGGTLHALGERVGSQVQVGHHAGCLQAQPARTFGEAPGCVHGIVVPLPVLAQLRGAEVVAADDARGGHTTAQHPDALRNATELIAHLRPTVDPATGHERRHTPHAAAVLEDDSIPVAVGRIEDSPLPHRSETAELTIEHHATLVGATDVISPIADLMPMASGRPGNHQQVVATTMLDHAGALEQAALGGTSLEELNVRVGNDIREVWLQFHHLARAVDDVNAVVVIEEERAVVEMTHTGEQRPLTFDIGGRINISVAHGAALVGSQESIEAPVVVLQRGSPLASAIDRSLLQVVLRRVRQTVEDVADGLPVLEVVGAHDGGSRHQVHGGGNHIESIVHADDIRVRDVGPEHRVLDKSAVGINSLSRLCVSRCQAAKGSRQQGEGDSFHILSGWWLVCHLFRKFHLELSLLKSYSASVGVESAAE